ncbi:MAG: hypothetical protein GXY41_03270 [Phycisphaerae bacterium]|nr:hypothetical protein [Phycisphaerae bacterium]
MKDTFVVILCLIVGAASLIGAAMQMDGIHTAREEMGLVATTSLENAPPSLAFATVAMGAFRGLVVNILWIRADNLKQEGKFFDAKQLAEWITTLQPRFAAVWDFHAWNMAYNISVAIPNTQPEERWRWVRNGYELLRDRAIPLNPNSIILYRSLAWIFQHKIGDISDDVHRYYKKELAVSMRSLLGEQPDNAFFDRLAAAPKTLEAALTDPTVASFIEALQQADPAFADRAKLVDQYLSLRQMPARFSKEAFAVIDDWRDSEALEAFDLFARAAKLRSEWKFDIDFMIRLNKQYGPVDIDDPEKTYPLRWDHPGTHAMYWGAMGLEVAGRPEQYRVDEKNTDRIIFHSLQMLFRRGRVVLYEEPEQGTAVFLLPDMQMFDVCNRFWQEIIEKYEEFEGGNPKAVRGGHKNFLENALVMFYQSGHTRKAAQIYRQLQTQHEFDDTGYVRTEYKVPMMTFIRNRLREELQSIGIHDATEFIISTLREGYFRYALYEDDDAAGRENMAREVFEMYQEEMGRQDQERVGLPSLDRLRYGAFLMFMEDPAYPETMRINLLGRIRLERPDLFERLQQQESQLFEELQQRQQQQQPLR